MMEKCLLVSGILVLSLFFLFVGPGRAGDARPVVRLAYIQARPGMRDAFIAAVTEGMRISVRKEQGVLALYCVADKNDPDKLIFFEIYASEEAYQEHRASPHFKKYIETTKDMVISKSLMETIPVELRDKWHR